MSLHRNVYLSLALACFLFAALLILLLISASTAHGATIERTAEVVTTSQTVTTACRVTNSVRGWVAGYCAGVDAYFGVATWRRFAIGQAVTAYGTLTSDGQLRASLVW